MSSILDAIRMYDLRAKRLRLADLAKALPNFKFAATSGVFLREDYCDAPSLIVLEECV
jgi:hypothetical protein